MYTFRDSNRHVESFTRGAGGDRWYPAGFFSVFDRCASQPASQIYQMRLHTCNCAIKPCSFFAGTASSLSLITTAAAVSLSFFFLPACKGRLCDVLFYLSCSILSFMCLYCAITNDSASHHRDHDIIIAITTTSLSSSSSSPHLHHHHFCMLLPLHWPQETRRRNGQQTRFLAEQLFRYIIARRYELGFFSNHNSMIFLSLVIIIALLNCPARDKGCLASGSFARHMKRLQAAL